MMGISQKVQAMLHMVVGPQNISLPFETDDGAERQFQTLAGMLAKQKPGDFATIHHDNGTVWLKLSAVDAITWTKEKRITQPAGMMPGPQGMRMS
jgi:hypothetical protein